MTNYECDTKNCEANTQPLGITEKVECAKEDGNCLACDCYNKCYPDEV